MWLLNHLKWLDQFDISVDIYPYAKNQNGSIRYYLFIYLFIFLSYLFIFQQILHKIQVLS